MKFDENVNHPMWTRVSDEVHDNFIRRAQLENCCVDEHGRVDIGAIVDMLVKTYADGRYVIVDEKKIAEHQEMHSKGFVSVDMNAKPESKPKKKAKQIVEKEKAEHIEQLDQDGLATTVN